jgi:hypothetical protein
MPGLLLQLMFAIGSEGIVPNTLSWYRKLNFKVCKDDGGSARKTPAKVYNVNKCIIYAMAAALEVYFWTKRPAMSEMNLTTYGNLIDNAHRHVFHLKILCTNILRLDLKKKAIDLAVSERNAVDPRMVTSSNKDHLIHHYKDMIQQYGNLGCLDTELGELFHKIVGKEAFANSNKQYGAELMQMANYVVKLQGNLLYPTFLLLATFKSNMPCMRPHQLHLPCMTMNFTHLTC